MNLSSITQVSNFQYIIFLFLSVALFYLFKCSKKILLIAGIIFYMTFSLKYTLLIFILATINYILGLLLEKIKWKKLLIFGIILDLIILGYFKYFNFFLDISNFKQIFNYNYITFYAIPLGVSFFTFELIHYIVDIKRGKKPIYNLFDFLLFVFFFPSLIAGPIKRFEQFIPQLKKLSVNWLLINEGYLLIIKGFFKKIVLATSFSNYVLNIGNLQSYPLQTIIGFYFFAFYIYFDFSGYIDIARGSASLFGIRLPINFNNPYLSSSIQDFWRRWNMTLMSWLKDYVYIPFGGSRKGKFRTQINILAVFILSGLWHGAGIHFIVWGLYNGILVSIQRLVKPIRFLNFLPINLKKYIAIAVTFNLVVFGWIIFNNNLNEIIDAFSSKHIFYNFHLFIDDKLLLTLMLTICYLALIKINIPRLLFIKPIIYGFAVLLIILYLNNTIAPFIYFTF